MKAIRTIVSVAFAAVLGVGCTDRSTPTQEAINASITSPREPDYKGHPNVGALWRDWNGDGLMEPQNLEGDLEGPCSGLLIAPRVFLTAGHCLPPDPPGSHIPVRISFDEHVLPSSGATWIVATGFAVDPNFNPGSLFHDLGVVFLPEGATTGLTPVPLPRAGLLDRLNEQNGLRGQDFLKVGYGVVPTWEGEPTSFSLPGSRNTASAPFMALTQGWLFLQANYNATGEGGACYWDSGSPRFLGDVAVATFSWLDNECRSLNVSWRLDTPEARDFLGAYVTLP